MTKNEALNLALEAITKVQTLNGVLVKRSDVEAAIKEALAQPEQPKVRTGDCLLVGVCASEGHKIAPQRTWVGLTDEEIEAAIPFKDLSGEYYYDDVLNIILFIQAKLKRKNAEEN